MKFTVRVSFGAFALFAASSWGWMGIKTKSSRSHAAPPAPAAGVAAPSDSAKPAPDTLPLSRKVLSIPASAQGTLLGTLEGVRCFNCAPDMVQLNLGDTASAEAAVLALRIEVWNAIERPLKDRRIYDYDNRCFYFGSNGKDTALVGGEWTEFRVQEMPCYPYVQRTVQTRLTEAPPE